MARWQLLPTLFEEYNELHGAFTVCLCFSKADRIVSEHCTKFFDGDVSDVELCGEAFIITAPLQSASLNEDMIKLFTKADLDFDKSPDDTKQLIICKYSRKSSWWKYTCNYEIAGIVYRGTDFGTVEAPDLPTPEERTRLIYTYDKRTKRMLLPAALDFDIVFLFRDVMTPPRINVILLLHLRFNHMSIKYIYNLWKRGVDFGVHLTEDMFKIQDDYFCKSCKCRSRLLPVPATLQQFDKFAPFQYVCMDGSGPMPVTSLHGNRYVWVILCLSTRWAKLYFSENKDQVTTYLILRDFIMWVKTKRFVVKSFFCMEKLLTDLGGEFDNKNLLNLASTEGFTHEFSSARMHHLNPHAERYMQSLWMMMNPTLFTADGEPELWEEVCSHSAWLKNRIGSRTLGDEYDSPYFLINKVEYNGYHRLRVLFSLCWPVTDAYQDKFKTKDSECLWLGIDEDIRGSVVFHVKSRTVFVAGMLTYFECPTQSGKLLTDRSFSPFDIQDSKQYKEYIRIPFISKEPVIKSLVKIVGHKAIFDEDENESYALVQIVTKTQSRPFWTYVATLVTSDPLYFEDVWEYLVLQNVGEDFPLFGQVHIKKGNENSYRGIITADKRTQKLRFQVALPDGTADYLQRNKINEFTEKNILCTSIFSNVIYDSKYFGYVNPKDHADAMSRHDKLEWSKAETTEMTKQVKYEVFVDGRNSRPRGHIHTVKLIYQIQLYADGTLKKYKVRLVFRGFTLKGYWTEFDIYAPVSQLVSLKLFLLLLLHFGLELYQLDVENAFLIPELNPEDGEIWCDLPEGIRINGFRYHRIAKTLYGCPKSAKAFYKFMSTLLMTRFSFKRHDAEPCLFYLFEPDKALIVLILLHVDNLLTGCNQPGWIEWFIKESSDECVIGIESTKSILGVQIERIDRHTFAISNENYIDAMIHEFNVQDRPIKHIPYS